MLPAGLVCGCTSPQERCGPSADRRRVQGRRRGGLPASLLDDGTQQRTRPPTVRPRRRANSVHQVCAAFVASDSRRAGWPGGTRHPARAPFRYPSCAGGGTQKVDPGLLIQYGAGRDQEGLTVSRYGRQTARRARAGRSCILGWRSVLRLLASEWLAEASPRSPFWWSSAGQWNIVAGDGLAGSLGRCGVFRWAVTVDWCPLLVGLSRN